MIKKLLEALGFVDDEDVKIDEEQIAQRKQKLSNPPVPTSIVICRGYTAIKNKDKIAQEFKKGKVILIDLRSTDHISGQEFLDFIAGVAYTIKGGVDRIVPGLFIALPPNVRAEEWVEEDNNFSESAVVDEKEVKGE